MAVSCKRQDTGTTNGTMASRRNNETLVASADSSHDKCSSEKRCVGFSLIELIEIAIVLGDNPSCTEGPPMSLGWEPPIRRSEMELDHFEKVRPMRKQSRRDMMISGKKRTKFFLRCGYSLSEIEEAAAISLNFRNQMTITKLLKPPVEAEGKVKDRFASEADFNPTGRCPMSRRNSNEPLQMPRRRLDKWEVAPSSTAIREVHNKLSDELFRPDRFRMTRRLSNFGPVSTIPEPLSMGSDLKNIKACSAARFSPGDRRRPLARNHSSPLSNQLGLRKPERIISPRRKSSVGHMEGESSTANHEEWHQTSQKSPKDHSAAPLSRLDCSLRMPVRSRSPIATTSEGGSLQNLLEEARRIALPNLLSEEVAISRPASSPTPMESPIRVQSSKSISLQGAQSLPQAKRRLSPPSLLDTKIEGPRGRT